MPRQCSHVGRGVAGLTMPDNRDHAMDLYRVVALVLIVVGHWVAACLTFSDGAFWRENPLVDLPSTQWLT